MKKWKIKIKDSGRGKKGKKSSINFINVNSFIN